MKKNKAKLKPLKFENIILIFSGYTNTGNKAFLPISTILKVK